jgi:hypothetical protein
LQFIYFSEEYPILLPALTLIWFNSSLTLWATVLCSSVTVSGSGCSFPKPNVIIITILFHP